MKKCNRCNTNKPKSEFYKDKSRKDGLFLICKKCHSARQNPKLRKRYKNDEQFRQRRLNGVKQWNLNNRNAYYEANREKHLAYSKEYRKKHLEEQKSRRVLRHALKTGEITKADSCESCSAIKSLDGHHEDYDKPLEVTWLCRSCHKQLHLTAIES